MADLTSHHDKTWLDSSLGIWQDCKKYSRTEYCGGHCEKKTFYTSKAKSWREFLVTFEETATGRMTKIRRFLAFIWTTKVEHFTRANLWDRRTCSGSPSRRRSRTWRWGRCRTGFEPATLKFFNLHQRPLEQRFFAGKAELAFSETWWNDRNEPFGKLQIGNSARRRLGYRQ